MGLLTGAYLTDYQGVYEKKTNNGLCYIIRYTVARKTVSKLVGHESEGMSAFLAFKIRLEHISKNKLINNEIKSDKYDFLRLFTEFIEYREPYLAKNTTANYKSHLNCYFKEKFLDCDVRTVDKFELQRYINQLLKHKRPATVEKVMISLKRFYSYLLDHGVVKTHPANEIHMPKYDNKKYFQLPKKDVRRIVEYIFKIENQQYKTIYMFLLHGRRIEEVLTLENKNIDLNNRIYNINYKKSKINKTQHWHLEEFQITEIKKLREQYQTNKYLFENPKTKRPLTYTSMWRIHKKLRNDLELENFTLHNFRHLIGFLLINSGHSLEIIAKILGHQNISSTQRYSELKIDKASKAYRSVFKDII